MNRLAALLVFAGLFAAAQTTEPPKRPRILGISHMALFVSDLRNRAPSMRISSASMRPTCSSATTAPSTLPSSKSTKTSTSNSSPIPPKQDGHMSHIAFFTDDVEGLRAYLAAQGVKVPAQAGKGKIGNTEFNATDPDGHTVEFVQYQPDSWTRRETGQHMPETRISTHIPHVGVTIRHLDAAQRFYGGILGFQEFWRGSSDGKTLSWVNLRVPDGGDGGDYLELMLYSGPLNAAGLGGKNHICLVTPDIVKAVATLNARPARKDYTRRIEIKVGKNGKRQANLYDPDGTRIELMEPGTADGNPVAPSTAPPPQ